MNSSVISTLELEYAGCAYPVEGIGPGKRLAMWVYGCRRGCAGCIAPELQPRGVPRPLDAVLEELLPWARLADGLTISGGEPFEQASALAALIRALRAHRDLEVLVYSGYLLEELRAQGGAAAELLALIDLLIDGPFVQEAANTLQWRGSDNQRVHLLSARAQRYADNSDQPMPEQRPLQVQMLGATRVRIIGIPRRGDLAAYRAAMAARGLEVRPDGE